MHTRPEPLMPAPAKPAVRWLPAVAIAVVATLAIAAPSAACASTPPARPPQTAAEVAEAWPQYAPTFAGDPYLVRPSVTSPYAAGRVQPAFLADGVRIINFARFLAGLPADVTLDAACTRQAQHGAVLLAASSFSHAPARPADMPLDFYRLGYAAASSSNIGWGLDTAWQTQLGFLDDDDTGNIDRLGHRRWLLNPPMSVTGIGFAAGRHTTYVFDQSRSETLDYGFVAWPTAGAFPVQFFGEGVPWSISLNPSHYDIDPSAVHQVTLRRVSDGRTWTFDATDTNPAREYFNVDFGGYGVSNCFVFRPDPASIVYHPGDEFEVRLSGGIFAEGTRDAVTISYRARFVSLNPSDAFEPDNSRAQAATLAPGVRQSRTLDHEGDEDWLAVDACAGQRLTFELSVARGTQPPSLDIMNNSGATIESLAAPQQTVEWRAPATGRYYLRVRCTLGRLDALGYSIRLSTSTRVTLEGPSTISCGASAKLLGLISCAEALPTTHTAILERSYDGSKWSQVATMASDANGEFACSVRPSRLTLYRARFAGGSGLDAAVSSAITVRVRALVTAPRAVTTAYGGKPVVVVGYLKPKHARGSTVVQMRFYHYEGGEWVWRRTLTARARDYLDHSMYSASVTLPKSGRWKVRAYHSDALHAPAYSAWSYFSVK